MTISSAIKNAIHTMGHNRVRSFLTMLGIMIGIATVIIVYSAGEGISGLVLKQIETFGTDVVETEVKVPSTKKGSDGEMQSASAVAMGVQVTTLTLKDMEALSKSPNVKNAYAGVMSQEQTSYKNETKRAYILGTSASYIDIDKGSKISSGRFFTDAEDKSLAQVVVLGKKIKDKLFGDEDPVGKQIKIRQEKFLVIGVMAERGAALFMDFDDYVYMPVRTLQKKIMGIDYLMYTMHQLKDVDMADDTAEEFRYMLRQEHDITDPDKDDFRVMTMKEGMDMLKTTVDALTLLLLGIVVISLIVGGVGVMNVMYVVVTERTMEIGLRKAVGAKVNDILKQFLIESIIITTIGGVLGIVVGLGVSYSIAVIANQLNFEWSFSVPVRAYVVSVLFSLICGVLFGLYPAKKAASLDPIEAIRNE